MSASTSLLLLLNIHTSEDFQLATKHGSHIFVTLFIGVRIEVLNLSNSNLRTQIQEHIHRFSHQNRKKNYIKLVPTTVASFHNN